MARLPGMMHVMQQSGGIVRLFEDGSEDIITIFDPADGIVVAWALDAIRNSARLTDEDKCFALLWAGYFHAHAVRYPEVPREQFVREDGRDVVVTCGGIEIVRFDPANQDAVARAQLAVHLSALSQDAKDRAHFWSGFHYGHATMSVPGRPA
jgi:hypothetical protein